MNKNEKNMLIGIFLVIIAQKFILALIVALLIISGISPVFTTRLVTPHIGLPFMIIGCVVTYANLRKLEISQH